MSDAFLISVVDSTQVGLIPALVTHEEVEIWAEAEEVEEKTQDLDDWEIAERRGAMQAKIVAVPLGWFQDLWKLHFFGHEVSQPNDFGILWTLWIIMNYYCQYC